MAAILDFSHNAMTKVRSGQTRMSDILENPMVHTKIMIVLLFENDINSLFYLAQMAAILDFFHNAMAKVLSYYITMSGITEARMLDTKIKNLRKCGNNINCVLLQEYSITQSNYFPKSLVFFCHYMIHVLIQHFTMVSMYCTMTLYCLLAVGLH